VDIDDEIFRDNLALVFANIFWGEFHLASLDIVA